MMNSTLPPEEYEKEQEVIRREFAMGMDDPDRMAASCFSGRRISGILTGFRSSASWKSSTSLRKSR